MKGELYPVKEMEDPLHVMVEVVVKEELNLKNLFQVFRIPVLYDYGRFLIRFVSEFSE